MTAHRCVAIVRMDGESHRCNNAAKVERNGKWYCRVHDPVARAARNAPRIQALDAKQRQHEARAAEQKRRADCYPFLLSALKWVRDNRDVRPSKVHHVVCGAIERAEGVQQ